MLRSLVALVCLAAWSPVAWGQEVFTGKVTSVTDGDTFVMKLVGSNEEIKVRIYGMDAPEKAQAFGETARDRLAELINDKTVKVTKKGISYGRVVGDVKLDDLRVSAKMISEGLAHWYKDFAAGDQELADAQEDAETNDRGIWKGNGKPLPPWEYRQIVKKLDQDKARKVQNP